jgi:nucleoside-diphosphate-sugar epimerase
MRIFLAGATGVIGQPLVPLLIADGHMVVGTTRSRDKAKALRQAGVAPVVVDVFDAKLLAEAVQMAAPEVVIHQLTDLPDDSSSLAGSREANARIRIEGTRNLIQAARAVGAKRMIAQSIAFIYAPGDGARVETDALGMQPDGTPDATLRGVMSLEQQVLGTPDLAGVVLRYARLYGPGTWNEGGPKGTGYVHVDAAAQAARLALMRGEGIYNIADDDGAYAIDKARRELGFDPAFRLGVR